MPRFHRVFVAALFISTQLCCAEDFHRLIVFLVFGAPVILEHAIPQIAWGWMGQVPSVDFRKLNWTLTPQPYKSKKERPGPKSLKQIQHDKAVLPTYPVIGMSLVRPLGRYCGLF